MTREREVTPLYTSETPYSLVWLDFRTKNVSRQNSEDTLLKIHQKWTKIGKLAKNGSLTGMKYV